VDAVGRIASSSRGWCRWSAGSGRELLEADGIWPTGAVNRADVAHEALRRSLFEEFGKRPASLFFGGQGICVTAPKGGSTGASSAARTAAVPAPSILMVRP